MDMIHSEEELRHAFYHLIPSEDHPLEGHECLSLYRHLRKKYADYPVKEGLKKICCYRTIDEGVLAAYQASLCFSKERSASALYAHINPRHVPEAVKATHAKYYQWLEYGAGTCKEQVTRGTSSNFAGTLYRTLEIEISHSKSRVRLSMIDVDDNDPRTWLSRIRTAIGKEAIEVIIETKNGFHVLFQRSKMKREAHEALREVLASDTGKGKDVKVTSMKGCALSCALPGAYQADHKTKILACSCHLGKSE